MFNVSGQKKVDKPKTGRNRQGMKTETAAFSVMFKIWPGVHGGGVVGGILGSAVTDTSWLSWLAHFTTLLSLLPHNDIALYCMVLHCHNAIVTCLLYFCVTSLLPHESWWCSVLTRSMMMTWNVDTYEQHKCTSEKAQWQKALFYRKLIECSLSAFLYTLMNIQIFNLFLYLFVSKSYFGRVWRIFEYS